LLKAAQAGQAGTLRELLGRGGNARATASNGMPAIAFAVFSKNVDAVRALLDSQPDVANQLYKDTRGQMLPPIVDALYLQQPAIVGALLKSGAELSWTNSDGHGLIELAVFGNDVESLRLLVGAGLDPRKSSLRHGTLLHLAATQDRVAMIDALFEYGVPVNRRDDFGFTPLEIAANGGKLESARALLEKGAWPTTMDAFGDTALSLAKKSIKDPAQSAAMVDLLVKHGASPANKIRAVDDDFLDAIVRGDLAAVKTALDNGADIDARRKQKVDSFSLVVESIRMAVKWPQVLEYLLDRGISVTTCTTYGFTALHAAANDGNVKSIELLVKHGTDVNQKSRDGQTALSAAVNDNRPGAVEILLKLGADPNARGVAGKNLLLMAREVHHSKLLAPLLEKAGTREDPPGTPQPCELSSTTTPPCSLQHYVDVGNVDRVMKALEGGMDINTRGVQDRTLLMFALTLPKSKDDLIIKEDDFFKRIVANRIRLARYLIDHGIDINAVDSKGIAALHIAATDARLSEFIGILLKKGVQPDLKGGAANFTALIIAAEAGNRAGLEALLTNGAKPGAATDKGKTALKAAVNGGYVELVEVLLKAGADPDFDAGFPPSPRQLSRNKDAALRALFDGSKSVSDKK